MSLSQNEIDAFFKIKYYFLTETPFIQFDTLFRLDADVERRNSQIITLMQHATTVTRCALVVEYLIKYICLPPLPVLHLAMLSKNKKLIHLIQAHFDRTVLENWLADDANHVPQDACKQMLDALNDNYSLVLDDLNDIERINIPDTYSFMPDSASTIKELYQEKTVAVDSKKQAAIYLQFIDKTTSQAGLSLEHVTSEDMMTLIKRTVSKARAKIQLVGTSKESRALYEKVDRIKDSFRPNGRLTQEKLDLEFIIAESDQSDTTVYQKRLRAIVVLQESISHVEHLLEQIGEQKSIDMTLRSAIENISGLLEHAQASTKDDFLAPEKQRIFQDNLKRLNNLTIQSDSLLSQIGLILLTVALLIAVLTVILGLLGLISGAPQLLPLLAAHCGFGLTKAIMTGTALSVFSAGTLAGVTVTAVPTITLSAVGGTLYGVQKRAGLNETLDEFTNVIGDALSY